MTNRLRYLSESPAESAMLGEAIGQRLRGGDVVALIGDLGAGKTLLAQAMGRALGIKTPMPSPTYVFERRHQGTFFEVRHWDLYRCDEATRFEELGLLERRPHEIVIVEWADRYPDLFDRDDATIVRVSEPADDPRRRVIELSLPERFAELRADLNALGATPVG